MRDLKGLHAVVVGGGSGIGRGVVLALAKRGVDVLVADIREPSAATVAREAEAFGVRGLSIRADITVAADIDALVTRAYDVFPEVNILVNSAGIVLMKRLEEAEPDDWRKILDINLFGAINTCRAFVPRMKRRTGRLAHIVNNASMAALVTHSIPGLGLYSVSKQGLLAYSEALAQEEAESGLKVSLLACGLVATGLGVNSQDYIAARADGRAPARIDPVSTPEGVMTAETAGEIVARGVEAGRFLIVTHPERKPEVAARYDRLLSEFRAV